MTYTGTGPSGVITVLTTVNEVGIPSFVNRELLNVVSVGKNGAAAFSSIKTAVDSITDSSSSNKYLVDVGPGTYSESPIVLPTYVNIRATPGSTTIIPADNNSPLISMSGVNFISSCQLFIPSNSMAFLSTNGAITNFDRVLFLGPNIGIKLDSGATAVGTELVFNYLSSGQSGICILVDDVTSAIFSTIQITSAPTGLLVTGGKFTMTNYTIKTCEVGAIFDGDTVSDMRLGNFDACQSGLCVNNNCTQDFRLTISDTEIRNSTVLDFESRAASGVVNVNSSSLSQDKFLITNFDTVNMLFFDEKPGEAGYKTLSEFAVGSPEAGKESIFGEGDSYTRGMLVYQSGVGSGTLVDITTIAQSFMSSTFSFPGISSGNAIYLSSDLTKNSSGDKLKFLGLKTTNDSFMSIGSGSVVCEYWNGAWTPLSTMTTESANLFMNYGDELFSNASSEQIRFNHMISEDWVKNDPISDGTDRYWVRFRIDSDITTSPVIQQWKLHANRTELNADGYIEYFGTARPFTLLPFNVGQLQPGGSSPGNQDVYLSDTLDVGRVENSFPNAATDRIAFVGKAPADMDTSSPLHFEFTWINLAAGAGNVRWLIRYSWSSDGDSIYTTAGGAPTTHANQSERELIVATSGQFIQTTSQVLLDFSGMRTRRPTPAFADLLWISIEREGGHGDDTYSGTAAIVQVTPHYSKWNNGGHLI